MSRNNRGVAEERCLVRVIRPVRELATHSTQYLIGLISQELIQVLNMVVRFYGIFDGIRNDC
jgi:hypothetical protein